MRVRSAKFVRNAQYLLDKEAHKPPMPLYRGLRGAHTKSSIFL